MFGILGFQHPHIQMFGESQFYTAYYLLGLLLKCDGLQKIIFWAPVWNSGFQQSHIQIFGESEFYNAYVSIVTSAERGWLTENQIWGSVWDSGFNIRIYKVSVNLSLVMSLFYSSFC